MKPPPLLASKPLGYTSYAVTPIFNLFFIFFISEYIYKKALFVPSPCKEVFQKSKKSSRNQTRMHKSKVHAFLSASREP